MNPYAAPQESEAPARRAPSTLRHLRLKYVYVFSLVMPFPISFLSLSVPSAGATFGLVSFLFWVVAGVSSMLWNHATWSLLSDREMEGVSPARAITNYFIPFYNLYWGFAFNMRIAGSLERRLGKYRTLRRAPTVLAWLGPTAMIACILTTFLAVGGPRALMMVLPLFIVAPVLTAVWMFRVDGCHEELRFLRAKKRSAKNAP